MKFRTSISIGLVFCGVHGGCSSAPHTDKSVTQSVHPSVSAAAISANSSAPITSIASASSNAESAAPQVVDAAPVGTFRGSDPFAAPPSAPIASWPPVPPRPLGTDPDDAAQGIKQCGAVKSCGACNNWGYCGYCAANRTCVPKDKHGPYPGTCPGGYTPDDCSMMFYFEEEEPKIHDRLSEYMGDLKPEGMPLDRNATQPMTVNIPVLRGKCYGATFRVSHDADGWLRPEAEVQAKFIGLGGNWAPIYTDTYAVTPFCPQESGRIVVKINPEKTTKGMFRVQLFSAPIAEAKLRKQMEEYETEMRRQMVRSACSTCAQAHALCLLEGDPHCLANYLVCLGNAHLTPADCERGDVPPKVPEKPPKEARFDVSRADESFASFDMSSESKIPRLR